MNECRTQIPAVCGRAMFSIQSGLKQAVKTRVSHLMGTLRHIFKASAIITGVIFCAFLLFVASYLAASTSVSISAGAGPWQPSVNPARPYGSGDQGGPAVFAVTGGQILAISASGAVDPDGAGKGFPAYGPGGGGAVGSTGSSGKPFPIAGAGLVSLVGAFTNASGVIVGGPIVVGNGGNFTAPVGASRLQLGVNDDKFSDNSGGFATAITVTYTPPTAVIDLATQLMSVGATLNGRINPNGVSTSGMFEYGLTNAYGNILGVTLPANNGTTEQAVSAPVIGLTPSTTYHYRLDATNSNVTVQSADGTFTTSPALVLRSDVNGDRKIDFSDTSLDKTTSFEPFRFWLNDDHDIGDQTDGNDLNDGIADNADSVISCIRDLEDFAPLNLRLPSSVVSSLHQGAKVVFSVTGTGSLHIVPISQPGFDYLYDPVYARTLTSLPGIPVSPVPMYTVSATASATVPLDQLFSNPQTGDRTLGFIFEGISAGDMVLKGTVIDQNGATVAATEDFNLHLVSMPGLYDHFTVGDSSNTGFSVLTTPQTLYRNSIGSNDPNTPYILFVHGWRLEPWNRRQFAETAYKRLFWAGYRGAFGLFSWPTEYVDVDDNTWILSAANRANYDRSEFQAWKSASGLRVLLNSLEVGTTSRVHLFAHSMGNIVGSEALHLGLTGSGAKRINNYVASQAASVACAYNTNVDEIPNLLSSDLRADIYRNFQEHGYFTGINSLTSNGIFSFCNPTDYALQGDNGLGGWRSNQAVKPDLGYGFSFDLGKYITSSNPPQFVTNIYEAFSFAAPATSRALGVELAVAGAGSEIQQIYRLDNPPLSYRSEKWQHSGEFNSTNQYQHTYWENLLGYMGLGTLPPNPVTTTPSNFNNWGQIWFGFSGASTTPQASFAGDGVSNLAKYAFGLNPLQAGGTPPVSISNSANSGTNSISFRGNFSAAQGQIQITFWRRANLTDVSYAVEGSGDLKTWSPTAASLLVITSSGQQELVKSVISANGAAQQFYRVKVTLTQ